MCVEVSSDESVVKKCANPFKCIGVWIEEEEIVSD